MEDATARSGQHGISGIGVHCGGRLDERAGASYRGGGGSGVPALPC